MFFPRSSCLDIIDQHELSHVFDLLSVSDEPSVDSHQSVDIRHVTMSHSNLYHPVNLKLRPWRTRQGNRANMAAWRDWDRKLFVVNGLNATSLTHYLSLSHIIILLFLPCFCSGWSPFLCSILPPSCFASFFLALYLLLFPLSFLLITYSFSSFSSYNSLPFGLSIFCLTLVSTIHFFISTSAPIPPSLLFSLSSGLSKDGGGSANAESLEEVLNILAEEGSDWIYGFFTFLYDVVSSPVERGEEKEEGKEAAAEMQEEGGTTSSDDGGVEGVILDLQNQ